MFRRARKFLQRHAAKLQAAITAIGTGITIATIISLVALGRPFLAAGLATWAAFTLVVGMTVSAQAEGLVAT